MKFRSLMPISSISALSICLAASPSFAQEMPSPEEMWKIILQQQEQISRLEEKLGMTEQAVTETREQVVETQEQVAETGMMVEATVQALEDAPGLSGGRSSATSIGGYGELHFNGGNTDQIDFHRYVLFVNHEFNDSIRFFSELELEHSLAGDGKPGEVELEQAFVEFDLTDDTSTSVGLQLVPVGLLNETHEPPTFYGVERNAVEKNIIPSTWWEAGVKFTHKLGETIQIDGMVHSGLATPIDGGKAFLIRSGRQKVAEALWKNTAFTGRLTWIPIAGVSLGASFQYQDDLTQSSAAPTSATLFEGHADIRRQINTSSEIGLRALYAQWNLNSMEAELIGRDVQRGWYIEPSYKYLFGNGQAIGIFTRYSTYDNNAGDIIDTANKQTSFGVNYWPHQNVVLKADYQIDNNANEETEDNRVNLGVGVQF